MLPENLELYLLASLLLMVGHIVRAARWALLFPKGQIHRRFDLLLGLALGYAINAILPWRLGEVARIWFVANRVSLPLSSVAATVVAERFSDLVAVCLIASFFLFDTDSNAWPVPLVPIGLSVLIGSFSFLVQQSQRMRRFVWQFASVFNDRIRFGLVDLVWSVSEMIVSGVLLKRRFLAITLGMWIIYVLSYVSFASASGQKLTDMVFAMLGSPLKAATEQLITGEGAAAVALLLFTGFPVVGVLLYGGVKQFPTILRLLNARRRYGWYGSRGSPSNTRNRFKAEGEYEYFLVALFSGDNKVATTFGLEAVDDGTVNKLFSGGSDAITALVEVNENLIIRKFAIGAAGDKLKQQHDWLVQYRTKDFPLVKIVRDQVKTGCYHYDMPFVVPANDFYDFIHTNPVIVSKRIVSEVVERITTFHDIHQGVTADERLIRKYVSEKGASNASIILDFAKAVFSDSAYTINGELFNLKQWDHLLDSDWMSRQIRNREVTVIHGDLTIENIIIASQQEPDWYIIDPNPENVFNTRLIDWAKLIQSVHLGYEGLNRNFGCVVTNNSIQLSFTKSQAYTELHIQLEGLIAKRFGEDGLREVYFHELMNYLRLTPYKIRQDPRKGMCFFACTSVLLGRYLKRAF